MCDSHSRTSAYSSSTYPSCFDIGSSGGGGLLEHMNVVDVPDIRARTTIVDRRTGLSSYHYIAGEGGGELLKLWFAARVVRDAVAGTDQRMHCFYVGFPVATSPQVLNTIMDREEEPGYNVVRPWVEGDLVMVNVSSFTEPQGEGIIAGSLVSFEATLHRHDHRHDCGVQREYFIHAHVAEVIRIDDPHAFHRIKSVEEGLPFNTDKHVIILFKSIRVLNHFLIATRHVDALEVNPSDRHPAHSVSPGQWNGDRADSKLSHGYSQRVHRLQRDYSRQLMSRGFKWKTNEGHALAQRILHASPLLYDPHNYQIEGICCSLDSTDLLAIIPTGCKKKQDSILFHEFVYRILQPGYPRYYPVYRFGSIGEVHKVKLSEQVRLLLVRIPSGL
ncbi:hypothetical protein B0H14DRAFT_2622699 [Mycena olivaceomarginata]|nr:hypothetical protein B0H14DRAFT_2622699 [Mycena olivaceomarginata]